MAGITITALFSENGIIKKAQEAKNETERDQADTQTGLSNLLDQMNNELGIDASAIANATDKSKYYGKTVSNYTVGNSDLRTALNREGITWKIFYADSSHIYLIAGDYVPNANLPKTKGNTTTALSTNGTYQTYWNTTALGDYYDSATSKVIMNSLYETLNKSHYDYLVANNSSNYPNNNNIKAVAYMLDKDAWSGYKDSAGKADYVIGGPTAEMIMKSYSEKYANNETVQGIKEGVYKYQAKAEKDVTTNPSNGYQISYDYGTTWHNYIETSASYFDTTDTLYINDTATTNAYGYWLASPSANGAGHVVCVACDGDVRINPYSNGYLGFRPVVSLKSDVRLKPVYDADGKTIVSYDIK